MVHMGQLGRVGFIMVLIRVVVIDFWDGFIDCNYLSLNSQLVPIVITKVANE